MSEKRQVRDKGVPLSYHHGKAMSSLADDCQTMHPPPAEVNYGKLIHENHEKIEVLHLFRCVTHTPCQGRVSFWKNPTVPSYGAMVHEAG